MQEQFDVKKKIDIIDLLFIVVGCCNMSFFLFSSDMFHHEGLSSLSARLFIVLDIIIFIVMMLRANDKIQKRQLVIMALMAFFAIITFISKISLPVFDFIIILIGYIAVPIYVLAIQKMSFFDGMINLLRVMAVIYTVWFIYRGYFAPTFRPGTDSLMLGYINPNITGAYIFLVCVFVLLSFDNAKNKIWRYFSYGLVVLLLYPLFLTQCRSAFFLAITCLIYAVFPKIYRPQKVLPVICIVFPWVFYYLYLYLYKIGWNIGGTLLDKDIYSGRQETFLNESIVYSLFGDLGEKFAGLNSAVGIINTLGIIGFTLFVAFYASFFTSSLMQEFKGKRASKRNLPLFCMCAMMLHGCVECSMFTAGTVYAGMVGCILVAIACNNKENHFGKRSKLL